MNPHGHEEYQASKSQTRTKPNQLQRRPGRNGSTRDRQGIVFDDSNGSTVRAVTPESPGSLEIAQASLGQDNLPSPARHSNQRSRPPRSRDRPGSASNTDDENTIAGRRRRAQAKAGAKEEQGNDASPGSFMSKTKRRLGSIATGASLGPRPEDQSSSIGFPSVIHASPVQEQVEERHTPKTPRRPFSPDSLSTAASGGVRSPVWLDPDSAKILQLMKTTCGRMHGILFFRPMHTTAWASGWCAINVAPGSLVCQVKGETVQTKTLIPDLRGCNVRSHYDSETQSTYLSVVVAATATGYQLRPTVAETFDSWLAALLCWQPLRPRGVHNKMTKPQPVAISERRPIGQRRISDTETKKSSAIIKVGKMLLWDGPLPSGSQSITYQQMVSNTSHAEDFSLWRRVSCTLHENGNFRLLEEADARVVSSTPLSQLSRSAVQRLDESVLNTPNCIAIYPHYTIHGTTLKQQRAMILGFESRVAFEAWLVLLRALTVPDFYGPEQKLSKAHIAETSGTESSYTSNTSGMFRIERTLTLKIIEAKFARNLPDKETLEQARMRRKSVRPERAPADVYADVLCGQDLRARTNIKGCSTSVFWADEFTIRDLSSNLNRVSVVIRMVNPGEREWTMTAHGPYDIAADAGYLSGLAGIEISSHDSVLGKVDVQLDELEQQGTIDKWWPIIDSNERSEGQVLMRISLQETVVLMREEYSQILAVLQNFSTGITTQIAHALGTELKRLSDVLLDFYQATGTVSDWICSLIEEEIDGTYGETPPMRLRYSGRVHSNDTYDTTEHRELLVRDLSRSATMEANLLFRGNSLVTKALDAHMRRLGNDYLNEVLGSKLRKIAEQDPDCEVDPVRIKSTEQLEKNWANLVMLTSSIWKAISGSASRCPPGLRILFKHIRSCAEDRYGSFIRTVKYTSVSGFLFLRFFCPAILNPKLFGMLPDHPPDQTKRTFTLIAKSLNVLANMAKFGTKEPWMEPMNKFLNGATQEFKTFIEEICAVSSSQESSSIEPQYATPNQIIARLPERSREGLPSLPFLLDSTKLLADVVEMWVSHAPENISDAGVDEPVKAFHNLCIDLSRRGKECLSTAETAEKPDRKLEPKWQQILTEQQKRRNIFEEQLVASTGESELTALPQPVGPILQEHTAEARGELSPPSSSASAAWDRRTTLPHRTGEERVMSNSTNSSTASFEALEAPPRPLPSSRDGPVKSRIFDMISSSGRRKGRGGDRSHPDDDGNEF